eukprot:12152593-Ditylum_brightwellii.AAC.1
MFYHFLNFQVDCPYIGVIYPVTLEHYLYAGMPMRNSSSPGITHQSMTAGLKAIKAHPSLKGQVTINLVNNHLVKKYFHPE